MKVFDKVKFEKIYLLEKEGKTLEYSFKPYIEFDFPFAKKEKMCAIGYLNDYFDKTYENDLSKVLVYIDDEVYECYSQNDTGFLILLLYYKLNKKNKWNNNIKLVACRKQYTKDYYFDSNDIYEVPSFIIDILPKVNDDNLIYFSHLISTCVYSNICSVEELKEIEDDDLKAFNYDMSEFLNERYKCMTYGICIYDILLLKGLRLRDYLVQNYNSSENIEDKIKWLMLLNIFYSYEEILLYTEYQMIKKDECLKIGDYIDYFE